MAFLTALDHQLFFAVHSLQKFGLDLILAWPTYLGSQWFLLPILLVLTVLQSRERLISRSLAVTLPVLFAHLCVDVMKDAFERPRPFLFFADQPGAVNVIFEAPHTFSFPSGHASTAFAGAVILSAWFGVPRAAAFGLAFLIALTRLYVGVHFPTDILAGGLWGFSVTVLWIRLLKARGFHWKSSAAG